MAARNETRVVWRYQSKIMAAEGFLFRSVATANATRGYCCKKKKMIYRSVHTGWMQTIITRTVSQWPSVNDIAYFLLLNCDWWRRSNNKRSMNRAKKESHFSSRLRNTSAELSTIFCRFLQINVQFPNFSSRVPEVFFPYKISTLNKFRNEKAAIHKCSESRDFWIPRYTENPMTFTHFQHRIHLACFSKPINKIHRL